MNLHHLAVFHAVARNGSVSAAAQSLHISQPAVSRELKDLEGRLGVQLFERLPRGMRLTEPGKLLHEYAGRIFTLERSAESAMHDFASLKSGSLELGASHTVGTYLLPDWLAQFSQRHPGIRLSLEIDNTAAVARGVEDYRFALGFVEGPGPMVDKAFEVRTLRHDRVLPVIAAGHPLAEQPPATAAALAKIPALLREVGSGTREIVEAAFAARRLSLNCAYEVANSEALKRAAIAGAGLAWISELCVQDALAQGLLVALPTHGLKLDRALAVLRLRERYRSPAVAAFEKLLLPAEP